MENASKALIIAGAILISILLISVGILVMNSTGTVTDTMGEEMDSAAIQSFNSKFTNYQGDQTGSTVKTLMTTIQSSNASSDYKITQLVYTDSNGSTQTFKSTSAKITNGCAVISADVQSTSTYKITLLDSYSGTNYSTTSGQDGYYDTIKVVWQN